MFILRNEYLDKKFKNKPYSLNLINGKIYIFKNNYDQSKMDLIHKLTKNKKIYKKNLLEIKSLKCFENNEV